jgi:hypothetical protein
MNCLIVMVLGCDLLVSKHCQPLKTNNLLLPSVLRILLFTLMRILLFTLIRIRILSLNLIRIRILLLTFCQIWTLQCSKNDHLRLHFSLRCGFGSATTASYRYTVFYTTRSRTGLALKWRRQKLSRVPIIAPIKAMSNFLEPAVLSIVFQPAAFCKLERHHCSGV